MKRLLINGIVIIAVAAIVLAIPASRHWVIDLFSLGDRNAASDVVYTCPMHPEIRLPQMGDCPICGMSLVEWTPSGDEDKGVVSVTPQQIQLTGITVDPVRMRALYKEIDAYGKIDYDETKLSVVSAWVGGRIDRLFIDFTGVTVNKGHALVDLYSPDLISSKREYLIAIENLKKVETSGFQDAVDNAHGLVSSSRQRLKWLGLSDRQIGEIVDRKQPVEHVRIFAPIGGTVIQKKAYPGMYVKEGDVLFHIADLSRVWLSADIYEDEIAHLYQERADDYYECTMHPEVTSTTPGTCHKCGMDLTKTNKSIKVEVETRAFPGETFEGYISFTDPFLNPETRTVRVRINIENSNLKLKPDMFARVKIRLPMGEMAAVPENAVIHSGTRKIVLVEEERGKFRPTLVKLGKLWLRDTGQETGGNQPLAFKREAERYHEVLGGLAAGDMVVTSGNFLLGSESQLQGALAKMIEREQSETEHRMIAEQTMTVTPPEKEEKDFKMLLDAYLAISEKLAGDTVNGIPSLAEIIATNAVNDGIKKAAEQLRDGEHKNDINAVRRDFRQMSDVMIAYVQTHKDHLDDMPVRIHCPMYGPTGADWLQLDEDVANPYFGSSMLNCGSVESWEL